MRADKKEGFTTEEDIDYFVAVSNSMKRITGDEPSGSQVREYVSEMKKKKIKLNDIDVFIKSKGGRKTIDPVEEKFVEDEDTKKEDKKEEKAEEKNEEKVAGPSLQTNVAEKLKKELADIADKLDELIEDIQRDTPNEQPTKQIEGFENFENFASLVR